MLLLFSNLTPLDLAQDRVDSIINEKYTKTISMKVKKVPLT